jgi:hypothetical protein
VGKIFLNRAFTGFKFLLANNFGRFFEKRNMRAANKKKGSHTCRYSENIVFYIDFSVWQMKHFNSWKKPR